MIRLVAGVNLTLFWPSGRFVQKKVRPLHRYIKWYSNPIQSIVWLIWKSVFMDASKIFDHDENAKMKWSKPTKAGVSEDGFRLSVFPFEHFYYIGYAFG